MLPTFEAAGQTLLKRFTIVRFGIENDGLDHGGSTRMVRGIRATLGYRSRACITMATFTKLTQIVTKPRAMRSV